MVRTTSASGVTRGIVPMLGIRAQTQTVRGHQKKMLRPNEKPPSNYSMNRTTTEPVQNHQKIWLSECVMCRCQVVLTSLHFALGLACLRVLQDEGDLDFCCAAETILCSGMRAASQLLLLSAPFRGMDGSAAHADVAGRRHLRQSENSKRYEQNLKTEILKLPQGGAGWARAVGRNSWKSSRKYHN